ncbi:LAMI_0D00518g1_1 [Lachancea mirantina]|uniref:LAMI_0D00518g1_1 n=1 Tax=Lachancea mirantina TaxID=1230905 RepID=A0A1G4J843_9SACH|nr:LAMI_0D00518g1_1 [Lachancea mirantina]
MNSKLTLPFKSTVDLAFSHCASHSPPSPRPPIILLHGVFGSRKNFLTLGKELSKILNTDIYSVDLRNHGSSPRARPYDYVTLSRDLSLFCANNIGVDVPVSILGFSMGGRVGLLSSLSKTLKVEKCISIDMPPYRLARLNRLLLENIAKIRDICERRIKIKKGAKEWQKQVLREFQSIPANDKLSVILYFASGFLSVKSNAKPYEPSLDEDPYITFANPILQMPGLIEDLRDWPSADRLSYEGYNATTDTVTLFLKGLKSPFIENDYSLLAEHFPNFKVEEFNTGHIIMGEEPARFQESVVRFFS